MKKYWILFFFTTSVFAQNDSVFCKKITQINTLIQDKHYKPKPLNDSLSVYVFNEFIKTLDPSNSLFIVPEINNLNKHKFKIDNYIQSSSCDFIKPFYDNYLLAKKRSQKIINTIISEPFSLSSKESIQFSKNTFPRYADEAGLKKLYKKKILFDILADVAQVSKNKDSIKQVFNTLAARSKIKIFESYKCQSNTKLLTKSEFNSLFTNTFCSYFDPHTLYFSNEEKSDFLSGLSATNYTFGIQMLLNDAEQLEVAAIIPYGPAFYSEKIEVGDIIQKITIDTTEYNFNCDDNREIYMVLFSNDTKKATFTFKKNTGSIYNVTLTKQLMRDASNNVYSYLLQNENVTSGYIKIPSFYSKFENGKTNVSDDVKRELLNLKDNNIKNLIIDLEDNTGGSMQEAIQICGFFINAPAVGIEQYAVGQPMLVGAESHKPIFSGSIVILINGNSASASEFLTNAMQDYSMAVVVGTTSFGKASIQVINEIEKDSKDFIKMTIGSFYRVTGKSNQKIGIIPNIPIPRIFDDQIDREKKQKKALQNQNIQAYISPNSYPFNEKNAAAIRKYNLEAKDDLTFQKIALLKQKVNAMYKDDPKPIALKLDTVYDYLHQYEQLFDTISAFAKTNYGISIYETVDKQRKTELNTTDKIGIQNIKTNFSLNQALKIVGKLSQ